MTREADSIDISSLPDLAQLADEVARTGRPCVLRRGDTNVAVVVPAARRARRPEAGPLTDAQRQAFLSAFGSWKGLVDADQLKRELRAARSSRRPPVEL